MAKRQKDPAAYPPITNPNGWDASHGTYIAGRAVLDGVDVIAAEMDAFWGIDRLRLLVSPELREKFDRQRYRLAAAIRNGDLETLRQECARMARAWNVLNAAAREAGAEPIQADVWEVALADGTIAAIVPDNVSAHRVNQDGRAVSVFTLEEVGRLLDIHNGVVKAKLQWPGATVIAARKSVPDPLDAELDDLSQPSTN
jgi:hypothetical protein